MRARLVRLAKLAVPTALLVALVWPRARWQWRLGAFAGLLAQWTYTYTRYRRAAVATTANERELLRTANWETYSRHLPPVPHVFMPQFRS